MKNKIYNILNPSSIALIGVSQEQTSFGYTHLSILKKVGYKGSIFVINPNADYVLDLKCYPSILEVKEEIDVAFIMTPKKIVKKVFQECLQKKVKGIVILTAGFAELDKEGEKLQNELIYQAKSKGVRVIGPNTLGFYSAPVSLDALMSGYIRKGNIALISQSGNFTRSLAFPAIKRGLGFSYIIGLGNQSDIQFHELIRYFRNDDNTKVIALYIEGLINGRKFLEEVRKTVKKKPVVILKSGRTEAGAKIVSSHTASLAGNDKIYEAAFKQSGAIQVENVLDFCSVLLALSQGKNINGNKIAILSEGGGDCAIATDICIKKGLELPQFSKYAQEQLKKIIPDIGQVKNPVDLAKSEDYCEAAEIILKEKIINGLLIVGGFAGWDFLNPCVLAREKESAQKMVDLILKNKKPIFIYSYYSYAGNKSFNILKENNIPLFLDHSDAVNAIFALAKYDEIKKKTHNRKFDSKLEYNNRFNFFEKERTPNKFILEPQAISILENYGLHAPKYKLVYTKEEASEFAGIIGFPVVLKIVSEDILHKSDLGCVKLPLSNIEEVNKAYDEIIENAQKFNPKVTIKGIMVSKMDTEKGIEIIIGGINDQIFGPVIMFGLGGIFVEIFRDISFRICPIDDIDAEEMIKEINGYPLLEGARGMKPVNLQIIKKALLSISKLLLENTQISEIDINPLKVTTYGMAILDARIILK
ncbi:MAG: acetate--CoA ligase family protein [Candidatus Humimicrobiaceae bacterium]